MCAMCFNTFVCTIVVVFVENKQVPVFWVSGYIMKRFGVRNCLVFTFICFFFRFLIYSLMKSPWTVLAAEPLHGITFALMWASCTNFANEIAPPGLGATMQGLLGQYVNVHCSYMHCVNGISSCCTYLRIITEAIDCFPPVLCDVGVLTGLHFGLGLGLGSVIGGAVFDVRCIFMIMLLCFYLFICLCVCVCALSTVVWSASNLSLWNGNICICSFDYSPFQSSRSHSFGVCLCPRLLLLLLVSSGFSETRYR
eukprot:m.33450 g.33450  ORF g.33450 m.33450 type:complete len:253 (+) comp9864_c0_seq1:86-844(+)